MSWLLLWIVTAAGIQEAYSLNSTTMLPATAVTSPFVDLYNRTQYCKWPCECPETPPKCPPGVSLLMDGCDCCKTCARQVGEVCNEADMCDYHKGLYCDYSSDKPRYEKGVCAYMVGIGCEHNGVIYRNGESFQPNCKYQCVCVNGAIGCVGLCTESQPPRVWCQTPRRIKVRGQCCEQWICDEPRRGRKTALRHAVEVFPAETTSWHKNCITQTTSWSPCSKTCGRGLSMRISNANERCELFKESRLCNLRPCEVDITKHIKGRNVLISTGKISQQTSPSPAAPARKRTGPNTAASAPTNAAASPTNPKPLTWSLSVPTGRDSPGRCCGFRPASATSAAEAPMTSLLTWRIITVIQRL
uniref:CCN family member 3 n=1 Tax=Astatotilapia calliptera TaxID=8154 RepID=A0A3P8QL25_ASTCA